MIVCDFIKGKTAKISYLEYNALSSDEKYMLMYKIWNKTGRAHVYFILLKDEETYKVL